VNDTIDDGDDDGSEDSDDRMMGIIVQRKNDA